MSQITNLVRYQQRHDVTNREVKSMRKFIYYRSLLLVLLLLPGTAAAGEPIPLLGGVGLLGIAAIIAIVGLFSINKRK